MPFLWFWKLGQFHFLAEEIAKDVGWKTHKRHIGKRKIDGIQRKYSTLYERRLKCKRRERRGYGAKAMSEIRPGLVWRCLCGGCYSNKYDLFRSCYVVISFLKIFLFFQKTFLCSLCISVMVVVVVGLIFKSIFRFKISGSHGGENWRWQSPGV
jgi:hypothetical protein